MSSTLSVIMSVTFTDYSPNNYAHTLSFLDTTRISPSTVHELECGCGSLFSCPGKSSKRVHEAMRGYHSRPYPCYLGRYGHARCPGMGIGGPRGCFLGQPSHLWKIRN